MTILNFAASYALMAVLASSLIGHTEACATAPPSPSAGSIEVVVLTKEMWKTMAENELIVAKVVEQLKALATDRSVVFFTANKVTKMPEMVGEMLGVHFEITGAFESCLRVLEFFQAAVKDTAKDQIVSATVKCGTFDTVDIPKP